MDTMSLAWIIVYCIMGILIVSLMFRIFWMDNSEYRPFLMLALFCAGLIQVSKIAGIIAPGPEGYFTASIMEYLGKCFCCTFAFSFIAKFYRIKNPRWLMVLMYTISMGFFFAIMFNQYHHLYYSSTGTERMPGSVDYPVGHGPLYNVYMAFLFIVMAMFLVVCVHHYRHEGKVHKDVMFQIILAFGGVLPFIGVALCLLGAMNGTDFTPIFTGLSIMIMSLGVLRYGMFDPVNLAREAVIYNTNTGVIVYDRFKRYLYANDLARAILPTVDFDADIVDGYELGSFFATPGRILERREKSYEVHTAEIKNKKNRNKTEGYIAYFTDVTDLFQRNKDLEKLRNRAENTAAQKSAFLANMSHEIRTPMNAILGMSELALKQNKDERIKDNLDQIKTAAESLLGIINDILDVSKMESGKFKITESRYHLRRMIDDVGHLVAGKLDEKKLRYTLDIDPMIPDELYGDDIRIKQVLLNLVNNAVKYTEKGAISVIVRQHKGRRGDEISLEFSVKDTGIGIRAEDRERIFGNYEQTEAGRFLKTEGTGLGLSICKELVTLMHGSIGVESIYGRGSRFYFEIPQRVLRNDETRSETSSGTDAGWSTKDVKALVVDDTQVNLRIAEGFLKLYGIDTDTAGGGSEAVAKVAVNKYDIIFIDKMMPDMDGLQTAAAIKEKGVAAPLIALSGDITDEAREEFAGAGFAEFLAKPLKMSELEQCLLRVIPKEKIIEEKENGNL